MILDTERQREMLLALIRTASWPGNMLKDGATLLVQVERAQIAQK